MSSNVEGTSLNGEDVDTETEFYKWLIQQRAKGSLIKKMIKNGYDSIDMLKAIGDDLDDVVKHLKLDVPEKINLKMILKKLSNKHSFVDPEEYKAVTKMENKLQLILNAINLVTETKQNIDQQVADHTKNIQSSFKEFYQLLNQKEINLIQELNVISNNKKNKLENVSKTLCQQSTESKKQIDSCHKLLREPIEMKEIEGRKKAIIQIANDIGDIKIITKQDTVIRNNNKINVILDKSLIIQSMNSLGSIYDEVAPILVSVTDNKDCTAVVLWKLIDNVEQKYNDDTHQKLKVEWTDIDGKEDWQYNKEFAIENINDTTVNVRIENKTATYLFRISYFNGKCWTNKSNIKSVQITQIVFVDKWDENNVGKGIVVNGNTITKTGDGQRSAFLTNVVSEGVHIWKFKANHLTRAYGNHNPLGIWKINLGSPITENTWFNANINNGYGYRISNKKKTSGETYGVICKNSDAIEMILNFNTKSLSYKVNEVDYGKAFDIEDTKYRAAFNCYYNGNSLTLISYQKQ